MKWECDGGQHTLTFKNYVARCALPEDLDIVLAGLGPEERRRYGYSTWSDDELETHFARMLAPRRKDREVFIVEVDGEPIGGALLQSLHPLRSSVGLSALVPEGRSRTPDPADWRHLADFAHYHLGYRQLVAADDGETPERLVPLRAAGFEDFSWPFGIGVLPDGRRVPVEAVCHVSKRPKRSCPRR